tara:strand:- start:3107 stop:4102 length:996 start_codon:yes stop_codon:yes gene_type:complete
MSTKENEQKNTQENKKFQSQKTEKINSKSSSNKNYLIENSKQQTITENLYDKIFNDLIKKKSKLDDDIKKLENKKRLLIQDIETNFSGQSENIAKRVKGFQDYLTGALQNLSQSVEKLDLVSQPIIVNPSPLDEVKTTEENENNTNIQAIADTFKPDEEIIRKCLLNFSNQPDFYAEPWKLRRSLANVDIEMIEEWFFNMGGRGALESKGSRPKNILLVAGLISILGELYGDQFQTLILASEPERLGEWRRVLQDSLGLNREDFGPNSGIVLFERAEGVIERADRLEANNEVPLIIIDASETSIEVPILQFPLWLAFVGTSEEIYEDLELV